MNITQINTTDTIGGAAKVANLLYKSLKGGSFNSRMFVGLKTVKDSDIKVINQPYNLLMHTPVVRKYLRNHIDLEKFSNSGWKKLLKQDSIVHLHNIHGGYFDINNLKQLKDSGKKSVMTLHDMWLLTANEPHTNDDYWNYENIETLDKKQSKIMKERMSILNNLDITYVLPSHWLNEKFERSFLHNKPHKIINNGVNKRDFFNIDKSEARKNLGLPSEKKILLFVAQGGINNIWKGGDIWEYTMKKLAKKYKDILFIEIGRTKSEIWENKEYLSVAYTEDKGKLRTYYNAADILCFPSKAENYSLVLLESVACGLPVLCFDVGGNKEIITDGQNGYVIKNISKEIFSEKLIKMLENKKKLLEISQNNINKSSEISFEKTVEQYLELYKSL